MKKLNETYSVVLPTFNEVGHIKKLISEITNILENETINYEILVVDDNSTDGTIDELKKISISHKKVKPLIRYNKKGNLVDSLNEGIQNSKYENIIWLDADFSHPPQYIENFIKVKKENSEIDVLVFSRFLNESRRYFEIEKTKPIFIDLLSVFLNKICKLVLFKNFTDYTSGFICIKKNSINNYRLNGYYGDYFINLIVHCFLNNNKIIELPFDEKRRFSGVSKTTLNKFDFLFKCYFYFIVLIKNKLKIIFKKKFN